MHNVWRNQVTQIKLAWIRFRLVVWDIWIFVLPSFACWLGCLGYFQHSPEAGMAVLGRAWAKTLTPIFCGQWCQGQYMHFWSISNLPCNFVTTQSKWGPLNDFQLCGAHQAKKVVLGAHQEFFSLTSHTLKIFTEIYQINHNKILQGFMSKHHETFLMEQSIHTLLLLMNKIFHKASQSNHSYILLKLNIIKAFDKMNWSFLYQLL